MRRILLLFCISFLFYLSSNAQKTPKREVRGAWITTHFNLDWPRASSHSVARQKDSLIAILDQHKATGMNTMFFQVRNQSDALYPSSIEPWSSVLTGVQGRDPGWDPLQFVIEETHKRGMELHAWLNPYRAVATASQVNSFVASHVAKRHPEWLLNNNSVIILNPGLPAVRDYILSVITDITQRYDVDGIHFDDYFYQGGPIRDTATYNADSRGLSHADWRRDNINILIKRVNETITAIKPWVKFGVSPSGIYFSKTSTQDGSATSTGAHQHYKDAFADSKKWIQEGWVDYLAPQLYWFINQSGSDYKALVPWWNSIVSNNRHIYIGQATYKVNDPAQGANWANPSQIPNQMRMNREAIYPNVLGEIAYRTLNLRNNPLNVRDSMQQKIYKRPALPPVMSWKDNIAPDAPTDLTAVKQPNNSYILTWTNPSASTNEMNKVRQFVIYRSESPIININDTANLLAVTNTNVTTYTDASNPENKTFYYLVTSLDRLYNESAASNVTDYLPPTITCPADRMMVLNEECKFVVPNLIGSVVVSDDVTPANEINISQTPSAGSLMNGVGSFNITLTARDGSGKSSNCIVRIHTEDKIPPVIGEVTANTMTLFPANHKMRDVTLTYSATDNCSNVNIVLSVTSNEPETGREKDWEIIDNKRLKLRAERKGNGNGRDYYVTITATDASGNTSMETITIKVPHDQSAVTMQQESLNKATMAVHKGLQLKLLKNPSENHFTVLIASSSEEHLQYRVLDHLNRLVESKRGIGANATLTIGTNYLPGTYYLEVVQGNEKATIKLTKL
jgi:uncharacterized lipoprotein YddW (UPF0748 family)